DGGEAGQVGQVDADAHDLIERAAGRRADRLEVFEHASCLCRDVAVDELAGRRVYRRLAREEQEIAAAHGLRVGTDSLWGVRGLDDLAGHWHSVKGVRD